MDYDKRFWTESESYHELAEKYVSGIQRTHPDEFECEMGVGGHCPYCRTKVDYMEYSGERVF